jgi:hypothetical protein
MMITRNTQLYESYQFERSIVLGNNVLWTFSSK